MEGFGGLGGASDFDFADREREGEGESEEQEERSCGSGEEAEFAEGETRESPSEDEGTGEEDEVLEGEAEEGVHVGVDGQEEVRVSRHRAKHPAMVRKLWIFFVGGDGEEKGGGERERGDPPDSAEGQFAAVAGEKVS